MANAPTISSLDDLRSILPELTERVNADSGLGLRAAANPLLAIEELGYTIAPQSRTALGRQIQFSAITYQRLTALQQKVFAIAGEPFDIDSEEALANVLFARLDLPLPQPGVAGSGAGIGVQPRLKWAPAWNEPLDYLRGVHKIMQPLLEYRHIVSGEPAFASQETYDALRCGSAEVFKVRFTLNRPNEPQPGQNRKSASRSE